MTPNSKAPAGERCKFMRSYAAGASGSSSSGIDPDAGLAFDEHDPAAMEQRVRAPRAACVADAVAGPTEVPSPRYASSRPYLLIPSACRRFGSQRLPALAVAC
jgi:hypothetical protein